MRHLRIKHPNEFYGEKSWGRPHDGGKERQYQHALYLKVKKGNVVGRPKKNKRGPKTNLGFISKSVLPSPYSDSGVIRKALTEFYEKNDGERSCKNIKKTPARVGTALPGLLTPALPSGKQTTNFSSMD